MSTGVNDRAKRRGGVQAANYVTHIRNAGGLTFCGREIAKVNCQGDNEDVTEATCRLCAKRFA